MLPSTAALAVITGFAVRLALPILVTGLVIFVLRRLDSQWQSEARYPALNVQKPECWKTRGCSPAQQKVCPAFKSSLPCWQVFRSSNRYLRDQCLGCDVLIKAPLPARAQSVPLGR